MNIDDLTKSERISRIAGSLLNDKILDMVQMQRESFETLIAYYRCAAMEIETKFNVLNEQLSIQYDRNPIESIKSRIKSMDSLFRKAKKQNIPLTLSSLEEHITDIAGVRVICSFPEDVYKLEEYFLIQDDVKLIERKDYIKNPKPSGYRSLHLIVEIPIFLRSEKKNMKVEVQIRTMAMDFWRSLEHKLRYKKTLPADLEEELSHELVNCAEIISLMDLRMQEVRNKLESHKPEVKEKEEILQNQSQPAIPQTPVK